MSDLTITSAVQLLPEDFACLGAGLQSLHLPITLATPLATFIGLLAHWNRAYNLTAVRNVSDMVVLHLLDSLSITTYIRGMRVIDVGTGPGLPGIPLALALPDRHITLLDANSKKIRFLRQAVISLELQNVEIIQQRVENYQPISGFDVVLSRAFAEIGDFVRVAGHLCTQDGVILAMQGRLENKASMSALPHGWQVAGIEPIKVPALDAKRHLVQINRI